MHLNLAPPIRAMRGFTAHRAHCKARWVQWTQLGMGGYKEALREHPGPASRHHTMVSKCGHSRASANLSERQDAMVQLCIGFFAHSMHVR